MTTPQEPLVNPTADQLLSEVVTCDLPLEDKAFDQLILTLRRDRESFLSEGKAVRRQRATRVKSQTQLAADTIVVEL